MSTKFKKGLDLNQPLDKKILFVGLDGASKRIIDKMIGLNELPTFKKLMNAGVYFSSRSSDVGHGCSAVIWSSIASGKVPDKHGAKSFYDTSQSIRTKRIWDIFDDLGLPSGILGHFLTWPPRKINGFMIPDLLALDKQCYPEKYGFLWELTHDEKDEKSSLGRMFKYFWQSFSNGIKVRTLLQALNLYLQKKLKMVDVLDLYYSMRVLKSAFHKDLFIDLYKKYKPAYSFIHMHLVDGCSHRYWKYMEPGQYKNVSSEDLKKHQNKIYNAYKQADRTIQDLLNAVDPNTTVVIASDHGFKASSDDLHWSNNMTIDVQKFGNLFDEQIREDLNFSLVLPRINISIKNSTSEKYKSVHDFIGSMIVSEDNKPLFIIGDVDRSNLVIYFNFEITDIAGKHIVINGQKILLDDILIPAEDFTSGVHDMEDGILLMHGPDICRGREATVTVFDIIPTILALLNLPVGEDMDGKVIEDAICPDFLQKYPVQFIGTYDDIDATGGSNDNAELSNEETEKLKGQLKDLGYL